MHDAKRAHGNFEGVGAVVVIVVVLYSRFPMDASSRDRFLETSRPDSLGFTHSLLLFRRVTYFINMNTLHGHRIFMIDTGEFSC